MLPQFRIVPLALACALGLPSLALAQATSATADEATELDEIIVTATRTDIALADSIVPAQLIDRGEIERSQARSLPELLRGRAGIDVSNQGGAGKLTTIFMRGAESDHVLVLVDGIRIGSASAGLASFQDLPVDQIERIEIVRGPRSSLYGSEAIGGVIQIFTRNGGEGFTRHARIGVGSNGLREAGAGFGNRTARGWIGVEASHQETDGINACNGAGFPVFKGCFADEPDRDGYRNTSLSLRAGLHLTDTLTAEGHFLNADAHNEYDGSIFGGNEAENLQQVVGGKLEWSPSARFKLSMQAGRAYDKSDAYFADASTGTRTFVNTFDTHRDTTSAQADIAFTPNQMLTAGADWQQDAVSGTTAFTVDERDNIGTFLEYQGKFGAHQLQASVRNDDNEQFGNHATGSVGWGMTLARDLKLNASYGTGFKAPTFNDLYFPFGGNPNLQPEESKTLNVGIGQYAKGLTWTVNVFETRIDSLTGFDSFFDLVQVDEARIRGAEFTLATTLWGWDVSTQLTHVDPRARARRTSDGLDNPNFDKRLPRRASNLGRIDVDRSFGDFRFGTTVNGAGARYDDAPNQIRLGGYATVDLRLEYAFHRDWSLQARATNLFDRDYATIDWFNQPGREYGLSLRYAPAE